jgi:Xaa-Pro aminopeptidase
LVLAAQLAALHQVKPGNSAEHIHETAVRVLVEGLRSLGLLRGDLDGLIERGAYRHLYMHRTGHWLGLDVHDVGAYRLGEHPVTLEEGMVLTVEPGLYVSDRLPVPDGQPQIEARWKGIGIRIEDDVAVSASGGEVLSAAALKATADMERSG